MNNTAESIMDWLVESAEKREPINPHLWLEAAMKLATLLQTEEDRLAEIEHTLIKMKAAHIEEGKTAAAAKMLVEADELYLSYLKLNSLIKRADKVILMAKKYATVDSESRL